MEEARGEKAKKKIEELKIRIQDHWRYLRKLQRDLRNTEDKERKELQESGKLRGEVRVAEKSKEVEELEWDIYFRKITIEGLSDKLFDLEIGEDQIEKNSPQKERKVKKRQTKITEYF